MKQWDIFSLSLPGIPGPHPVVIVSGPLRVERKPDVNVLMCSSQRLTRAALDYEAILDMADGLDWPTLCRCDLAVKIPKAELTGHRGFVTPQRQMEIVRTMIRANNWRF